MPQPSKTKPFISQSQENSNRFVRGDKKTDLIDQWVVGSHCMSHTYNQSLLRYYEWNRMYGVSLKHWSIIDDLYPFTDYPKNSINVDTISAFRMLLSLRSSITTCRRTTQNWRAHAFRLTASDKRKAMWYGKSFERCVDHHICIMSI